MSGGHFDYQQHRISEIADSIERELAMQGKTKPKDDLYGSKEFYEEYPDERYYYTYPETVQCKMKEAIKHLRIAHIYAQRVDWFLSGDDGEESFIERLNEELDTFLKKNNMVTIKDLVGKTLTEIKHNKYELIFITNDGEEFKMYHEQDCCELVSIDDINGDLDDLIGVPILTAEEVSNEEFVNAFEKKINSCGEDDYYMPDHYTWTFYKLATVKGYVDIRWFGESNGYYSESVDFVKVDKK